MVKHSQIIRQQQQTNCPSLSVFDYFVELALKELRELVSQVKHLSGDGDSLLIRYDNQLILAISIHVSMYSISMYLCIQYNNNGKDENTKYCLKV